MKKLIIAVLLLGFCGLAHAESLSISETLQKLPSLRQGFAYSLADSKFNYLSTLELIKWKGLSLEGGYAGAAENTGNKAVMVLSYNIVNLKNLGVTMPILDLVTMNVGAYAGYGRIESINSLDDSEFDYGISLTLIDVKF